MRAIADFPYVRISTYACKPHKYVSSESDLKMRKVAVGISFSVYLLHKGQNDVAED